MCGNFKCRWRKADWQQDEIYNQCPAPELEWCDLMWLTKCTSLWEGRHASQACLSLRHLSYLAFWCFSESCFSQFKDTQVRRHFRNQCRQCILSLLCSEPQSTVLWSALCKRSDDYLKMPLNLKTSLSWLLNSNPGLILGQHHSTGSTSLTQCYSTPRKRKVPVPSVPAQALPSMEWVSHSTHQNRKVILSSALHMHNENTFILS